MAGVMPLWRRSDRLLIIGPTRSGKSSLARAAFASLRPPRAVVDPKADVETTGGRFADGRDAVTFHDPARLPAADVIRFVPRDPFDLDAYDRLYRELFERRGIVVWTDEAGMVAPASGAPPGFRRLITQGAGRGIGHLALHQRPVELDRSLFANAEHLISFRLRDPDDVRRLAGASSIAPRDLAELLGGLPDFGFAWYAAREQRWRVLSSGIRIA